MFLNPRRTRAGVSRSGWLASPRVGGAPQRGAGRAGAGCERRSGSKSSGPPPEECGVSGWSSPGSASRTGMCAPDRSGGERPARTGPRRPGWHWSLRTITTPEGHPGPSMDARPSTSSTSPRSRAVHRRDRAMRSGVGEPWVDPVPCLGFSLAVVAGVGDRGDRGLGRVSGLVNRNSGPCLGGRPLTPCIRGGLGRRITRSERTRPTSSTGRSRRIQARRVTSWPASLTITMPGSPACHWPAAMSRSTTPRSWAAVTAVASSAGPSRTASGLRSRTWRPAPAQPRRSRASPE